MRLHSFQVPWPRRLALAVLLLAFALRVYRLGDQNIWWDEGYSVYVARHSLDTLTTLAAADTHPPLYYWLLHLWMGLGGQTEFALRFPSVVFGVLAVAGVCRLGRYLTRDQRPTTTELVAVLAALLLAINRFHVWWSQEIRMYGLATMWTTATLLLLVRCLSRMAGMASPPNKTSYRLLIIGDWLLYALAVTAGMYSLYLFIFVAGAEAVFILWMAWRQERRRVPLLIGWGSAMIATVLALLPWLLYMVPRLKSWSAASQFSPLTYLQVAWTALTLGLTEHVERYVLLNVVFAAILFAGALAAHVQRATFYLSTCVLLIPLGGVFILLTLPQGFFYRPPLEARYQLLAVPTVCLLLAASVGAMWRWRRWIGAVAAMTVVIPMVWVLPGYYQDRHLRDDLQTMTRAIEAYAEPGDALLLVSGDRFPLFNFRYDVLRARATLPAVTTFPVRRITPADVEQLLVPLAQAHRRVWLAEVEKNLQDPDGLLGAWLEQNRQLVWREEYGYNRLTLYSTDDEPPSITDCKGEHRLWAEVGDALFWGYDLPVHEVRPGDVARWVGYFKVGAPFTLTVSLNDARGRVLQTRDYWLEPQGPGDMTRVRFDVPVYSRTPPGDYHFALAPLHSQPVDMPLRIAGTPPLETLKSVPNPGDVRLGSFIHLIGYQAPTSIEPGDQMQVKLYWQTQDKIAEHYTVFVQLIGAEFNPRTNGPLWAGHDSQPLDGGYPTPQWFVNVPVADAHVLTVPPDIPAGDYELWVGMYTQPDVRRLPVYDSGGSLMGDHVLLGKVKVESGK